MERMPGIIVAIGGGNIRTRGTAAIDREIIRLSKKKNPKLLFIPTASSDSEMYWKHAQEYFGEFLKCKTDVLFLVKEPPSKIQIQAKIRAADIIYVGGGNTLMMMRVWRRLGVDKLLKAAYEKGAVLSGISAGAICWFDSGHSDSMSFYNPRKWKYINVKGLGLIRGIFCPHYNSMTLRSSSKKALRRDDAEDRRLRHRGREQLRDRGRCWEALQSRPLQKLCARLQSPPARSRSNFGAAVEEQKTHAHRISLPTSPAR